MTYTSQDAPRARRTTVPALLLVLALAAAAPPDARAALLASGDAFPAWTMRDQQGKPVRSKDLAGKTYLLWFYPKAMTPGCTIEGNALRDSFASFTENGVEVFGVSFDDPPTNAKFVQAQQFPFRLLTDDGTLATKVGAADVRDQATPRRISYLVGPDGKVLHTYGSVNPATHAQDVLADVAAPTSLAPPASGPPATSAP